MAVIAPAPGLIWASTPSSSSSSFAYSQRSLAFSRVSLRSSFLSNNVGVPRKPIGMRLTLADRCKCHGLGGGAQMHLFSRFARILKSYASSFISIFEDPEKILEQTVIDMDEDLTKMRQASAQVLASQKQIENKYKSAQQTSEDWYKRAKLALSKGNEDLAREALNRRKSYAENANTLKAQLDQQNVVVANLVSNTRLLESKIQEAKSKKDTLKARAQSAKTATKVTEMLGNVKLSGALAAFEKLEEKVWAMESQAQALNQLVTDDLEGKFALLESFSVDDDLASLKKDISGSVMKRELPPGRTAATVSLKNMAIEEELDELRSGRCS